MQVARLAPGREYQLRVRAGNAIGWGQWAEPTSFTTEPDVPGAVQAPVCCHASALPVCKRAGAIPVADWYH